MDAVDTSHLSDEDELSTRILDTKPSLKSFTKETEKQSDLNTKETEKQIEKPDARAKYEKHVKRVSVFKHIAIFLVVVTIIIATVFYIRKMKRESKQEQAVIKENELDFDADEIAEATNSLAENMQAREVRSLEDINSALIQSETYKDPHNQQKDKTVDNRPVSGFEMPKFEIGGGVLSRTRTENDVKQSQPRFRSFVGFDRSQRGNEENLNEADLNDANLGMFGRGHGRQLQKMKPRITLAMRTQMTEAQIDALVNQTANETASMSQAKQVLEGIEELKAKSKKKTKKSKNKK